jgi:hypothetical protein
MKKIPDDGNMFKQSNSNMFMPIRPTREDIPKVRSVSSEYSYKPEEMLITISRIKSASCPFRYYKEYIERPKCRIPSVSIELGLGEFFHSFLESHFKEILSCNKAISRQDTIDIEELVDKFGRSLFDNGKTREPYRVIRDHNPDEFFKRLKTIGNNFNLFMIYNLVGHEIMDDGVEGTLEIETDSNHVIRGKYDLITKDSNGRLVLWDWKTGKVPDPADFDNRILQKVQLGIYAIWMRYMFNIDNIRATAVFLRDEDGVNTISEVFDSKTEEDILRFLYEQRTRLNNLSSYKPVVNGLCAWCGWKTVCIAFC